MSKMTTISSVFCPQKQPGAGVLSANHGSGQREVHGAVCDHQARLSRCAGEQLPHVTVASARPPPEAALMELLPSWPVGGVPAR